MQNWWTRAKNMSEIPGLLRNLADRELQISSDCKFPVWTSTSTPKIKSSFPENTIAVVIDIGQKNGAFRIFDNTTGKYLEGVGVEEKGRMVMIPWDSSWNYDTIGTLRFAYLLKH